MIAALRAWPRRRWIAAGGAFPVLAALLAAAGRGAAGAPASWWVWPWLLVTGGLAALVLASYLAGPGSGKLIEVGCSPCAAASALAVGGALLAHASAPGSPLMAVVATGLTLAAVRQRLTDAAACPARSSGRGAS
jgi:hypothetical protein